MTDGLTRDLTSYAGRYPHIRLERDQAGILEVTLHSDGGSLKWGAAIHDELGHCFADIAQDTGNAVVILTGAGDAFCAESEVGSFGAMTPATMIRIYEEGRRLLQNLLAIEVPVIAAVNGAAHVHAELPLLSNIVLASDQASFRDAVHFVHGAVPGDGVHVVWPALLGPTRASYFLLTGETIEAGEAKRLGLVNEVLATEDLLPRARALASSIARVSAPARRFSRALLTRRLRHLLEDDLERGLALEALAILESVQR